MASTAEDHPHPSGLLRRLQFFPNGAAVIDLDEDVLTAAWTTSTSPGDFISTVGWDIGFVEPTATVHFAGGHERFERRLFKDLTFRLFRELGDQCDLIRVDVSATQSVAWQRLPKARLDVVAIGDHPLRLLEYENFAVARSLLTATANHAIAADEVLESVLEVGKTYGTGSAGIRRYERSR